MIYVFDACELDTDLYELRRAGEVVKVEPQVFDVLVYLIEQRDRVVSKEELLDEVWKTRFVTESTLTTRIKAARRAVGDDGRVQQIIGTVHGRGYRFVAQLSVRGVRAPADGMPLAGLAVPGRELELSVLERCLSEVVSGSRRIVVVSGEPGVGKTALVDAFGAECRRSALRVLAGQCVEYRGAGEPYHPLLEAIAEAASSPDGEALREVFATRAPSWLVQMPWLVDDDLEFERLRRRALGSTRDRMLREIVEALEALADVDPLVLILEDLHWSDPSTIDVVARLGRRRADARLLLVGTCRAEDVASAPGLAVVLQDLRLHDALGEIRLPALDESAAAKLIAVRTGGDPPVELVNLVHERAAGNPLHMASLVDDWANRGLITVRDGCCKPAVATSELAAAVPETLRQLIEQRMAHADPSHRQVLEAAAVVGRRCSAAAVAAANDTDAEEAEAQCSQLARQTLFLERAGGEEWPDGTVAGAFEFAHDLYQEVIYERVPPARRTRMHRQVGRRLQAAYGSHDREHAAELAMHFVRGRDVPRAVTYLRVAAEQAVGRSAYAEAHEHIKNGLEMLSSMPDDPARSELELALQAALGPILIATRGWAAPDVERAYERAHELSRELSESAGQLPSILCGLATLREYRGEYRRSAALLEEVLDLEPEGDDTIHLMGSYELLACSMFHQGKFDEALKHAQAGTVLYDPELHLEFLASYGENPGVGCYAWGALASWYLGKAKQANEWMALALDLARDADHEFSVANAHEQAAVLHQLRAEPDRVERHASAAIEHARTQGFGHRVATSRILLGWAEVAQGQQEGGLQNLQEGIAAYRATGARMDLPYFLGLLADAYRLAGGVDEGFAAISEALDCADDRGYCFAAELHRLRGLILADRGAAADDVEAELSRALDVARSQRAPILQLRAAIVLSADGETEAADAAKRELEALLGSLDRDDDNADTRAARALLDTASSA